MWSSVLAWLSASTLNPRQQIECSRETLAARVDIYMSSQATGNPLGVIAMSFGTFGPINYTEDFMPRDPLKGVLATPLRIDHNRSVLDTTQCASYTELIIADAKNPRVIGTQMRYDKATGE